MIAHRQEITGHAPGQDRRTVAGFHVRPDILEGMSATLSGAGWTHLRIESCRACGTVAA